MNYCFILIVDIRFMHDERPLRTLSGHSQAKDKQRIHTESRNSREILYLATQFKMAFQ